jgi:hypothetical protein
MQNSIHTIYWDAFRWNSQDADWPQGEEVLAIWPAPVNADACFAEAGFTDFDDSDEQWEQEWQEMIGRLLAFLKRYGEPRAVRSPEVFLAQSALRRLASRILGRKQPPLELSILQQITVVTQDDQFGDVLLCFGQEGKAGLWTGTGHEVLVVKGVESQTGRQELLADLAENRPLVHRKLDWSKLLPGSPAV